MQFSPFRAIRPTRDKAALVGSRSYVDYSDSELDDKLKNNPYTFLHIINPDFTHRKEHQGREKFVAVKREFNRFVEEGVFIRDEEPAFYLYRQTIQGHAFTGLIGATAVEDYLSGKVKVHENTLTAREEMFREYLEVTGFNAEPVLLTYPDLPAVNAVVGRTVSERAEYEFTTTDRVLHELWIINDPDELNVLQAAFRSLQAVYIADGHHRCASSARLAQSHADNNPGAPHQAFMSILIPESQLRILPFHRMVKDLNRMDERSFLTALEKEFRVERVSHALEQPGGIHSFGLYLNAQWYRLSLRGLPQTKDPVSRLDCHLLSEHILGNILNIRDLKTDPRIRFVPGSDGIDKPVRLVDEGSYAALFTLAPVSVEELKAVSDAGQTMPPKSTYVEPKLRSGLTVYDLFTR